MGEWLARALFTVMLAEPASAKRSDIAERIKELHSSFGQEPAVREQLTRALKKM